MRLEYLSDGAPECPLIRLFDFTPAEASLLGAAIARMVAGGAECVAVHEFPGVVAVGGCELVLQVQRRDQGVVQVGPMKFECRFSPSTWDNVAGLVEPFASGAIGHQWLARTLEETLLLLSVSGTW